jgi:hypothetical protein
MATYHVIFTIHFRSIVVDHLLSMAMWVLSLIPKWEVVLALILEYYIKIMLKRL